MVRAALQQSWDIAATQTRRNRLQHTSRLLIATDMSRPPTLHLRPTECRTELHVCSGTCVDCSRQPTRSAILHLRLLEFDSLFLYGGIDSLCVVQSAEVDGNYDVEFE
jgi:hypothetical protein